MNLTKGLIDEILVAEGWPKYTNRPTDRGGPTKGGITLKTLRAWRGQPVTAEDVQALNETEVRRIYEVRFVEEPRFAEIDDNDLRYNVVDAGVLHGPGFAARRLQEIVGVTVDGKVGPVTLRAVNEADDTGLNLKFSVRRVRKVVGIALHDRSQLEYLRGWVGRALKHIEHEANLMMI